MCADFKVSGKHPFWKDGFTIVVMTGTSSSTHFLSSQVGIGSRSHDVDGDFMMISLTASSDTVDKSENVETQGDVIPRDDWVYISVD